MDTRFIHTLEKFGVSEKLLEWLRSYLTSCSQKTVLCGVYSNIKEINAGVPKDQ